ncbi:hypothetical protein DAPPUDRAFT_242585 [Daphnia pulex]|uniref:CRIB domain-containing protein n=1 Tax=Daphnia pulex TaxID=6669 RepID=E9GH05_DAPPU|nr:hypothetical protein DAPPUDRAFT_242585 [Daphnia pulex]|eukprot:EFX81272.1 hypothetical protein DAPPUDRAFT_242585 [Daphnia pulex]
MISALSNFNHISHMGPVDRIQMQRLLDLPQLDKVDQFVRHQSAQHLPGAIPLAGVSTSSSNTNITGSPSHMMMLQQQQQQQQQKQQQGIQRVASSAIGHGDCLQVLSMFQQSGSKLTAPRVPPQPADPSPPRVYRFPGSTLPFSGLDRTPDGIQITPMTPSSGLSGQPLV